MSLFNVLLGSLIFQLDGFLDFISFSALSFLKYVNPPPVFIFLSVW